MQQSAANRGATILCIEGIHSNLAASQQIFHSGIYEVATATTTDSAIAAIKAIQRIDAVVLAEIEPGEQLQVVAEINAVRPKVPKIVIAPLDIFPPPAQTLNLVYVKSVLLLNEELRRLLASSCAQLRAERQKSVQLGAEASCLQEETKRLLDQASESPNEKSSNPTRPYGINHGKSG